jgi:hypothetical protein
MDEIQVNALSRECDILMKNELKLNKKLAHEISLWTQTVLQNKNAQKQLLGQVQPPSPSNFTNQSISNSTTMSTEEKSQPMMG